MKTYHQIAGLFLSFLCVGFLASCGSTATAPSSSGNCGTGATVVNIPSGAAGMGAAAFGTNPLSVTAGTTVKWVNQDSMSHTASSNPAGTFDSGTLTPGSSFCFTFNATGTFNYICSIHGASSMSGSVVVH